METTFVSAEFLTPTFITDPTTYSVYCDLYISKGNTSHAYILDSNKLLEAIVEKTGLSIPGAIRTLTECSLFKHKKVEDIVHQYKIPIDSIVDYSFPNFIPSNYHLNQIHTCVRHPVKGSYLPGSTVKGNIRTLVLLHILHDKKITLRRRERTPWVGENFLRDNARNINEDAFSALQVTDSSCINNNDMGVFLLERLNSRGVVIENPYIGFARGSVSLKLQLYKNRLFPSLQYFWNLLRESSLLSHTRQIANLQQNKVLPAEPLKRFVKEYENAIDLIKQDKNCCVFRNGTGKTIMENSIRSQCDSSLVQDYNRKYFRKANPNHIPLSFCFAKAPREHLMKHVPTGFVKFTLDTKL